MIRGSNELPALACGGTGFDRSRKNTATAPIPTRITTPIAKELTIRCPISSLSKTG
jgi:hypothetical protein